MIKNWQYHNLHMDFSSMFEGNDHPSDIDMFYMCKDGTMIVGEIKNERGQFTEGQRKLLTKCLNMHKGDAIGLYITHDKLVQNGDEVVDVSSCPVREIYTKKERKWRLPKRVVTVKEVLNYYKERAEWKTNMKY